MDVVSLSASGEKRESAPPKEAAAMSSPPPPALGALAVWKGGQRSGAMAVPHSADPWSTDELRNLERSSRERISESLSSSGRLILAADPRNKFGRAAADNGFAAHRLIFSILLGQFYSRKNAKVKASGCRKTSQKGEFLRKWLLDHGYAFPCPGSLLMTNI